MTVSAAPGHTEDAHVADLRHTNDLLAESLIEANDTLLGIYSLLRLPGEAADSKILRARLVPQVRRIARAAALGILPAGGVADIDTNGLDAALVSEALAGTYGSGILPATRTGLAHDLFVRRSSGQMEHSYAFVLPEGQVIGTAFTKLAVALIDALDSFLSVAALHEEELRQSLIERDATAAAELAQLSLPTSEPSLSELEIASRFAPARLGGGDLIAWQTVGDDFVFAVGDVAGKGLPAAVVMTVICESIGAVIRGNPSIEPDQLLQELSSNSFDYLNRVGLFVTVVAGRWSASDATMSVANAGHSPLWSRLGGVVQPLNASCPPIGVLASIDPSVCRFRFAADDLVVVGSDGLVEQEDDAGVQLGEEPIHRLLAASRGCAAVGIVDAVFAAVDAHGGDDHDDDQTLLVVRRKATPTADERDEESTV